MKKFLSACLFFLTLFLTMPHAIHAAEVSAKLSVLTVSGEKFLDAEGREVILRGINTGGRSKIPPFLPFDPTPDFNPELERYADAVEALGFNVVRLLIIYEAAEPVRGEYNEAYLRQYDALVAAFARRNIRVIVDSHQDLFSRRLCGDGFPDWALDPRDREKPQRADCKYWSLHYFTPAVTRNFDRLYSNTDGLRDSYVAFFAMLAERYRDEPAVIGFEPMNEPMPGARGMLNLPGYYRDLFELYEQTAAAVQAKDPRYLIFADLCPLENQGAWNTRRRRPNIENLVLAPHYYDPGTFGLSLSPGGDQWMMRRGLHKDRRLGRHWDVPVLLTEYGISPLYPPAPLYINKLYAVFDELKLSGTFWEASISQTIWNEENTSLFEPNGAVRPASFTLDRPYPAAVAGTIESFAYDAESRKFELTWRESPGSQAATEVRLPAGICGTNPVIHLDPEGESRWDANRQKLTITPSGNGGLRNLEVMPGPAAGN